MTNRGLSVVIRRWGNRLRSRHTFKTGTQAWGRVSYAKHMNLRIVLWGAHRNRWMNWGLSVAGLAAGLGIAGSAQADLVIDLPELSLAYNQPNQTFSLSAQNTGGSAVSLSGLQLELQVADGGPAAGGTLLGPSITEVRLTAPGTLFGEVPNTGEAGGGALLPQIFQRYTSTASGTLSMPTGPSVIATITFDTSGVPPGDYTFAATSLNGPSFFTDAGGPISATLLLGNLTVVPEVGSSAMVTGLALAVTAPFLLRRRAASRPRA